MATRLAALRGELARLRLDGYLVPRADEHLGEYVPASAERLAWLTGFTGSAGLAIVLAERAAVFTDGRYTLQLAQQADAALWQFCHIVEQPPPQWLAAHAAPGARIGYDPRLIAAEGLARYTALGLAMVPTANAVDAVWHDRPPPPAAPATPHPLAYAGKASAEKRRELGAALAGKRADAAVLGDPASIAWLLNLRGGDLPFTPCLLAHAILHDEGRAALFTDPGKIDAACRAWLGDEVTVSPPSALAAALGDLGGKRVLVDPSGSAVWFAETLRSAGAVIVEAPDPCLLPKACKNAVEQEGARAAHRRDAVALCRFLHWLDATSGQTELSAAAKLLALRGEVEGFRGESFPAISGAGEHGAIIHYRVDAASDRALRRDEPYLIDSGGQYPDGTTDVTRTVWIGTGTPPAELRRHFTRVLQGHVALATLRFPAGSCGQHLDGFARRPLWQDGLDYDHGTGHGVGSFLGVHEGPVSLSRAAKAVPLAEGMILSDEPGYYRPGAYGIRLENLLLVQQAPAAGERAFLQFETLTLAPFDRRLLDPALLDAAERAWLDAYHARVLAEIGPAVAEISAEASSWLAVACTKL